ncbi:hypothetical protein BA950_03360 [Erythrobacter sp. SAORIC-644]|uniref:hypothetical protein n=1 Tax=Erythrobacter sp. SAORIC-644 TaxID=1869314 RepID=UPI000C9ECEA4|nr:hypothetical protein [Erythrobacter sp. SAORIC-644]PNQ77102.1 hypothetical protein BA950_03360 [Erythrobacter sp. SAORIC-644]
MTDTTKTNTPVGESQEARQAGLAPETHNDEQDDHRNQAQEVAEEARETTRQTGSPTESRKSDMMNDSTQDTVDHMRDMESSGRIDMGAFRGEDNHDDNEDKYGKSAKVDPDLPSDGS